jgi:hypothetical protein
MRSVEDKQVFISNTRLTAFENSIFKAGLQFYYGLNIDFRKYHELNTFEIVISKVILSIFIDLIYNN